MIVDEVKDALANTSLCSHLIKMAQSNVHENAEYSEDNQQKVKMASDLLILLLTGGESFTVCLICQDRNLKVCLCSHAKSKFARGQKVK